MRNSFAFKRIVSIALTFVFVFTLVFGALAASFTDVSDDYWAKTYIDDLTEKGYFSGYDDGSFKPNASITTGETLVLLSRFYSVDDSLQQLINEDYQAKVKADVPSSLSWAYDELSVCLAAGIVTESELKSSDLTAAVTKEDLALYLVRAIKLEDEADNADTSALKFKDNDKITAGCLGSIALLYNVGVIDGDDDGNFNPEQPVTRAVAAAMIYRTLSYVKSLGINLVIDDYDNVYSSEGVISYIASGVIRIELISGITAEFKTSNTTVCYVNDASSSLSTDYVGSYVKFVSKDNAITKLYITYSDKISYVTGTVYSISTSSNGSVNITPAGSEKTTRYYLTQDAYVQSNGTECTLSNLSSGDFVLIKLEGGYASSVYASSYETKIYGSVTSLTFGTTVELRLTDENSAVWYMGFDIANLPDVYIGDYQISIDRISVGDYITVNYKNGSITKIAANGTQSTLTGEVTSMINSVDGLSWEIKDSSGTTHKYQVDDNVTVTNGTKDILLSSIKVGDSVTVTIYASTITAIKLETTATTSTTKLTGTVLNIDTSSRQITILYSGKLYYVSSPTSTPIYKASTGKSLSISQVSVDDTIVAYGSYDSSNSFAATLVIDET